MTKKCRSEEDVKSAVEKKIKKPVNPLVWEKLIEERYIEEILGGFGEIEYILDKYKSEEEYFQKVVQIGAEIYGARRLFPVRKEGNSSASETDVILSKLIAAEVSKLPFVKQFRREVLGEKLLQPDEIESWIQATKEKDGPPTQYVKIRAKKVNVTIDKDNWWPLKIMPAFEADDVIGIEHEFLSYPSKKEWAERVSINVDGILGRLKRTVHRIITFYCPAWQEAQTVAFVLTGQVPIIPRVRYSVNVTSSGGPCWVTLKFDARIKPQDLAREYSKIRRKIMGNSHAKPLTKKHQELAVFAAEHKEGLTWEKLMHKWNEKFPKWAYKNYRLFCRDAIGAINRLLNGKVNYASLLGSEAQKTTANRPPPGLLQ